MLKLSQKLRFILNFVSFAQAMGNRPPFLPCSFLQQGVLILLIFQFQATGFISLIIIASLAFDCFQCQLSVLVDQQLRVRGKLLVSAHVVQNLYLLLLAWLIHLILQFLVFYQRASAQILIVLLLLRLSQKWLSTLLVGKRLLSPFPLQDSCAGRQRGCCFLLESWAEESIFLIELRLRTETFLSFYRINSQTSHIYPLWLRLLLWLLLCFLLFLGFKFLWSRIAGSFYISKSLDEVFIGMTILDLESLHLVFKRKLRCNWARSFIRPGIERWGNIFRHRCSRQVVIRREVHASWTTSLCAICREGILMGLLQSLDMILLRLLLGLLNALSLDTKSFVRKSCRVVQTKAKQLIYKAMIVLQSGRLSQLDSKLS